jgi:ESCRT-II complex subunit VPS25
LNTWKSLLLGYQKHKNQAIVNLNEDVPPFVNESINRKLPEAGRFLVLDELSKSGNAFCLDRKTKQQWEVYWHTLDEWGAIVYGWAVDNGMTNTVCTLFELTSGDNTVGEEFYGLDQGVLRKALKVLEDKGKCELIAFDDNEGVKFF